MGDSGGLRVASRQHPSNRLAHANQEEPMADTGIDRNLARAGFLLVFFALVPGLAGTGNSQLSAQQSPADSLGRFPRAEGTNLEGRRFSLPADFEGEFNVVLVAFRREQQADVDTWVPFLRETAARRHDVRVYELPTLNRTYRLMRGFIDGGMARGIPVRATRETTITLYIDKAPFKKSLAIAAEDHITCFLVTRDGRVLWRADGRYTVSAGTGLAAALGTPQ
jgi:hypothetical protein